MFVKVCGTTSEQDALLAVAMGADAVGFVFAPSPRQVAPGIVRHIVRRLPPEILTVGVFRDEAPERVVDIVHGAGLRAAQLHGHETPEQTSWVHARVPIVLKAFAAGDPSVSDALDHGADVVMVDSATPGSGKVFDWSLTDGVPDGVRRLVLAGGLHAGNVGAAIARVRPWGVDVSSGVEESPGHKDPRALRAFVAAARAAARTDTDADAPPADGASSDDHGPSVRDWPYDWQEHGG